MHASVGATGWSAPSDALALSRCEAHVWRIDLDDVLPPAARATLSADEEQRARQFRFPHLTRRFVAARATLRAILARYTRLEPSELVFTYAPRGKPSLASLPPDRSVAFNVSHSDHVGLCAVTSGAAVGVDIERIHEERNPFEAVDRYFSVAEVRTLRALDPAVRREACYSCWTRKEALLKARGDGLSIPLDAFDVSCDPREPARLLALRGPAADQRCWTLRDLGPLEGFAGALVVEGTDVELRRWYWRWPSGVGACP